MKPANEAPMSCVIEKPGLIRTVTGRHYFSPARIMQTAVELGIDSDQVARLIGRLVFEAQDGGAE